MPDVNQEPVAFPSDMTLSKPIPLTFEGVITMTAR